MHILYALSKDGGKHSHAKCYIEDFLYDLEKDPYERHNLVRNAEYEGVREQLAKTLKRRMKQSGESNPIIEKTKEY